MGSTLLLETREQNLWKGQPDSSDQGALLKVLGAPPRVRAAQLAREAAQSCLLRPAQALFSHEHDGPFQSVELLGLLTFSYGTGIFSLERLYEMLHEDVLCRSLLSDTIPHPNTTRRFRQLERNALQSALDEFFQRMATLCSQELTQSEEQRVFLAALGLRMPVPTCSRRRQIMVTDRVNQATWVDRMMDF